MSYYDYMTTINGTPNMAFLVLMCKEDGTQQNATAAEQSHSTFISFMC